jgi:Ser/Thr protein kinase RdoA (MazF antagonist)
MLARMTPDPAHIHAILADVAPPCALVRASRPRDGIANAVFFLETTGEPLVLKVFDDATGAWKPQKERAVFTHMRALGIPAPAVHRVDASKRVVPFVYSLSERLPGEPYSLVFPTLSEAENAGICAALGDSLGRLHATTFDAFGDPLEGAGGLGVGPVHELTEGGNVPAPGPFATWREAHDRIVAARLRLMRGTAFADLILRVEAWFDRHDHLLADDIVPRLLHMDLHRGNVLIANGKVAGILDVEEAIAGHNEYDLMRTELANFRDEAPTFRDAFLAAYRAHVTLDAGYEARQRFYDLSRALVWIRSLILYGDGYARGATSQNEQAARAHVLALTAGS